jgi:hypothetical protein
MCPAVSANLIEPRLHAVLMPGCIEVRHSPTGPEADLIGAPAASCSTAARPTRGAMRIVDRFHLSRMSPFTPARSNASAAARQHDRPSLERTDIGYVSGRPRADQRQGA